MRKYKNKLITAAVILAVLTVAWFWGSSTGPSGGSTATENESIAQTDVTPTLDADIIETEESELDEQPEASPAPSPAPKQEINPDTGKDKYKTDPVPEGKPLPVEPQDVEVGTAAHTVTLTVQCGAILNNMGKLRSNKAELVPQDGVIFPPTAVTFYEGESVFNVLQREMRRAKIHMAFRNTPIYNSAYIEAINNLYEFDCGELSGWMYKVNGWFPNYGCSRYQLKPGDVVEWIYTCDLGRDIGGGYAAGGQSE